MRLLGRFQIKKILKKQGKSRFTESVGHALDGINYVSSHERNFKIEILFAIMVTIASFLLKVSLIEWSILMLVISLVLALEMINTSIERCVDLVTQDYKELAKIAKDVSAGAVLVVSIFSIIIGIVIFLPKIILLLS